MSHEATGYRGQRSEDREKPFLVFGEQIAKEEDVILNLFVFLLNLPVYK
jgi:hypothetical protein